ncbi:hypothetical protein ACJ41O_005644 [Fusarium nematophilum]
MGQGQPARHAILVGINAYRDKPLRGCVRDIQHIQTLLEQQPVPIAVQALTATPGSGASPVEDPKLWPTYSNVTAALRETTSRSRPGDLVYIHYSGHGTRFEPGSEFSNRSTGDLALALLDGESGELVRPLGGHRLALALNAMVAKGLVVTLVLDCCFAASAYRLGDPKVRFIPLNPESSADAGDAAREEADLVISDLRDASMLPSWLMNPKGYALLAACGPHQEAAEIIQDGNEHGALSRLLYLILRDDWLDKRHKDIYYRLCAKFRGSSLQQSPVLYGNKDQVFFGQCSLAAARITIPVVRSGQHLILRAGQAHGVSNGDDFVLYPCNRVDGFHGNAVTAQVDTIQPLTSTLHLRDATASSAKVEWVAEPRARHGLHQFPVSLSEDLPRLEWRAALAEHSLSCDETESQPFFFHVTVMEAEYKILDKTGQEVMNLPAMRQDLTNLEDISNVLEHLARYELTRSLTNHSPEDEFLASFDISVTTRAGDCFSPGQVINVEQDGSTGFMFELKLENKGTKDLYVYVFDLGPFWQIEDIYCGSYEVVPPVNLAEGFTGLFSKRLRTMVPNEMRDRGLRHCDDVLKVLVTSQGTSFDLLELPKVGLLLRRESASRSSTLGEKCPEQWAAFNFPLRTFSTKI